MSRIRTATDDEKERNVNECIRKRQDGDQRHAGAYTSQQAGVDGEDHLPQTSQSTNDEERSHGKQPTSLLISMVDLWKPVLETWRMVHRMPAMATSPAAAKALIIMDKSYTTVKKACTGLITILTLISTSWAKVLNRRALIVYAAQFLLERGTPVWTERQTHRDGCVGSIQSVKL